MGRVFTNGLGNWGSIPGRIMLKTTKMVLDATCLTLSIIRYRSRVKSRNLRKGVAPSLTPWYCVSSELYSVLKLNIIQNL